MYYKKTVVCKNVVFTYKYHAVRTRGVKKSRACNMRLTSAQQQEINKRIAQYKRMWLACNNFGVGDVWLTLTYRKDNRPQSLDEGHKNLQRLIRQLRDKLKRQGAELVYMAKSEQGKRGAVHHHILVKAVSELSIAGLICDRWVHGNVNVKQIYTDHIYALAEYYAKAEDGADMVRFMQSRNLVQPRVKVERVKAQSFRRAPAPRRDCMDLHLYNACRDDGYEYQEHFYYRRD